MKHLYLPLVILFVFSCSSVQKTGSSGEKFKISKGLNQFLLDFETSAKSHDKKAMLNLMDKEYLHDQLDNMLEGRTDQFFNEFFAGRQTNGKGFRVLNFDTVTTLDFTGINQTNENSFEVFYIVKTPEYQINCQWQIKLHSINGKTVFGLVGASG